MSDPVRDLMAWADAYEHGGGMSPYEVRASLRDLARSWGAWVNVDDLQRINIIDAEMHCPECGEFIPYATADTSNRGFRCLPCNIVWRIETSCARMAGADDASGGADHG